MLLPECLRTIATMPAVAFASATEPFRPPPPGFVPNFVDPPTRAHMLITVTSIVWVISTFFVICRCYTRFFLTRIYGVSDCNYPCFELFDSITDLALQICSSSLMYVMFGRSVLVTGLPLSNILSVQAFAVVNSALVIAGEFLHPTVPRIILTVL